MIVISLLLISLLVLLLGALVFLRAWSQKRWVGLPKGTPVYRDTAEQPGVTLRATSLPLVGKPDYLIRHKDAIIPVEVKSGRTPKAPFPGHVAQLFAYCLLVEECYSLRPAYGVLRYPAAQFRLAYTAESEAGLRALVAEMVTNKRTRSELHRQHNNPRLCAGCGMRSRCDESLATG